MPDSPSNHLILLAGGGHALVVAEAAFDSGWSIAGFYDDRADAPLASLAPHLGPMSRATAEALAGRPAMLCVGDLAARAALLPTLSAFNWARVRHPGAVVSRRADISPTGVYLGARCVVNIRARVGDHAIINTGAIIEHECAVGANSHVAPGAILCGNVTVGDDTLIGAGARVIPNVRIGSRCVVGAGAVVVRDVPDGVTVIGVPGRAMPR